MTEKKTITDILTGILEQHDLELLSWLQPVTEEIDRRFQAIEERWGPDDSQWSLGFTGGWIKRGEVQASIRNAALEEVMKEVFGERRSANGEIYVKWRDLRTAIERLKTDNSWCGCGSGDCDQTSNGEPVGQSGHCLPITDLSKGEIIGNLHENPELLK